MEARDSAGFFVLYRVNRFPRGTPTGQHLISAKILRSRGFKVLLDGLDLSDSMYSHPVAFRVE